MKRWISFLQKTLLVGCILLLCVMQPVLASETDNAKDSYTYTVTLLPGVQGTFTDAERVTAPGSATITSSEERIIISGLKYGDEVSVDAAADGFVALKDSGRYYVKGIRKAGRDNSTAAMDMQRFTVESDVEYVIAYGIRGNMVSYTINYRDQAGKELAASRTYYGSVGDKPALTYQYIEGYRPQEDNLTGTLSQNEAENVFTFRYE